MNLVLGLVFFLCLMFLAMIFGERLSLFGFLDGRWLTAPFDLAADFWDMVCELADRIWCFIFDHFWWVTAAVSGGIGIVLIALIMVSGLTNEAHAVRTDEKRPMMVGSVLDDTPVLDTDTILQTRVISKADDSQLIYQYPSRNRFIIPADIRRPVVKDFTPRPRENYVPPMPLPRPHREPDYFRGRLQITMEPFLERHGHRIRSEKVDRLIQQTVLALRHDDWRTYSDAQAMARQGVVGAALREDSDRDVTDLYDRVRVIPGDRVTSNSLKIEKSMPENPGSGEFEIQVRVTNVDRERISGLIVRELLPASWSPVDMQPRGAFRNSVITWLVDDIEPLDERLLTLRVQSPEAGRFQSFTEISATSAVSSLAHVADRLPAVPRERSLPPVVRRPDVRLTLDQTPSGVRENEWVDVIFMISNIGDAPAEGVKLRVNLPFDLDHHDLTDADTNRWVDSKIRRLEPGERRRVKLTVQPRSAGRHLATAELLFQAAQLDVRNFSIVADRTLDNERNNLRPRPDFQ